jgi:DNA-binding MarR family transcriptional regulator
MRLEEEIKTKGFRSEIHKLSINLIYTYNWLMNESQNRFSQFGITMQQFNILRILRGQAPNPCTIQLLKARMLDKQPDASRLVDRLVAKGFATRTTCEEDRRKMDVKITEAGLALLDSMEPVIMEMDTMFKGITNEEAYSVNEILDRIRDNKTTT